MEESRARELMERAGILLNGHFVYTSWKHGPQYLNKDRVFLNPVICSELCYRLAKVFTDMGIEIVVGAEKGGIIIAQLVALHMSNLIGLDVLAAFAEKKEDGTLVFQRDYDTEIKGKQVLAVEDIIHTGLTGRRLVTATRQCGGHVVAVGALWNRGTSTRATIGNVPLLTSLVDKQLEAWDESEIPPDLAKIPINTNVGKGREYLARQGLL